MVKEVYFKSTKEWRAWLEKNHLIEDKVAVLKYKKHTGKPSMSHKESMDEAICFGWIDTTIKKLDDDRYVRNFSRRTEKSRWSNATLGYAKEMIKQGKMSEFGMKMYKLGLLKPVIDLGLSKNPDTPKELIVALSKNKVARENFDKLAPSYRRTYIYWIERAKRPETREKRVKIVVDRMASRLKKFV